MRVRIPSSVALFLILVAVAATPANAGEIYKWVDEDGVVHFSDKPPAQDEPDLQEVAIQDTRPSDWNPDEDIYGVAEQAERMQAMREEMETKRRERIERQRRLAELQPQPQPRQSEPYGYPIFWGYPRPPLRPRPPIARPDPGPGAPIRPPGSITPPKPIIPEF